MTKRLVLVSSSVGLATLLLLALFTLMATLNAAPVRAAPAPGRQHSPPADPVAAPLYQATTTPTYVISDSVTGGIVYDWVEISDDYDEAVTLGGDNAGSAEIAIGFYFPFYDNVYRTLRASTNGYIYFGGTGADGGPTPIFIGSSSDPNNFIAPFGADLYMYPNVSQIYVSRQFTRTVIEFVDVQWCCGLNDPHTFEIILYRDGRILTQYRQIRYSTNPNERVVAGIENNDGSDGAAYYQNWFQEDTSLGDGLAVLYDPADSIFGHLVLDPPAQIWWDDPGRTGNFDVNLFNLTGITDTFNITYSISISSSVVPTESLWPVSVPNRVGFPGSAWLPLPNLGDSDFQVTATIPVTAAWWDVATLHITTSATTSPTIFSNTVTISYGVAQRDLSIAKTLAPNEPPSPGGHFRYQITVTNDDYPGSDRAAQARAVRVTDTLPVSATLRSLDPFDPDDNVTTGTLGNTIVFTWNVGDVDAYDSETLDVMLWVPSSVPTGTVMTNTAWTTMTGSAERGPFDNNVVTHTLVITENRLVFDVEKYLSDPDDVIGPGQLVSYTVRVENQGNVPITGTVVTDVIPLGAIFHSTDWPTNTLLADNRTVVFTVGTLLNGAWNGLDFQVVVSIPATTTIGTWLTNTVQVTTTAPLTGFVQVEGDSASETFQVIDPRGDAWVEKSPEMIGGNPVAPEPGGDYTFWINYSNVGNVAVYSVTLTDTLPLSYVVLLEAGPAGAAQPVTTTSDQVVWHIPGALEPGESGWIRLRIRIDEHTPAGTQLLNTAEIAAVAGGNITTTNDVSSATITLEAADVTVDKWIVPTGTLEVGDRVTYTVRFTNTGALEAAGVRITDVLPSELTNVHWITSEHPCEALVDAPPLLVWRALQPMDPGDHGLIVITGQLDLAATWPPQPLLSNRAEIRTTTGEKPSNDSNEAEISSSVALAWPYVVKTGPTLALPGETITYVVEYGNGGLLPAEGVWLTDTLPVSTTYVADTSGLTPVTGSGWISWNVGTISSETTGLTFTLVVSVSPDVPLGIPLRNSITLTSTTYDGDRTDNESEWTTPVGFDLSNSYKLVNGTAGTSVGSGTPVTYTIVLTNRGPYSATSVLVRDPVPADTAYITQSLSSSSGEDGYDPVDDVIIWMGIVSDHTMVTVTFQVTVADAGLLPRGTLITNAAFISDSIQTFQASVPVTITGPNLDGSYKTVNNLQPSQGERITYTIVLSNSGEADAIGAVMTDDLPSAYYATYAGDGSASSGSLGGGGSGDSITWTGTITTSHQVTILLPVKVVAGPGNHFANTAHIDDGTGRIIQRSVTVSTTKPILEAEKVASAGQVASGGRVTYTIAVTNSGNGWAWSARVTDTIQGGSYISSQVTASSGALNASPPPTITWTGPLTPGFSVRITIPVTITAPPGSDVDNVAQISDGYETVFNRSTSVHVYSTADISNSIKAVDLPAASPGETLVYTLTVVNDGESATSFVVTDTPDAATAFTGFIGSPPGSYGYTAGVITWTGTANGSSQAQLSFQTIISDSASGAVTNTAHFDGAGQVYTRTARTQILVPAELTATKQVEPVGPALAGEYLTYTIIVSNPGGEVARAILTDTIPTHTDYIFGSAEGPPTHAPPLCDGSTLTWQDDVAPDEAVTLTFQVMVTPGTVTGTVVSNVAWLQELNEPGPVFSDSVTNTVLSPVFTATKRATPAGFVLPGKPLTYSIVVTNVEAGIARVVITDPIPLDTTYITGSAQVFPGTHNPPTCAYGVLTWQGDVDSQSMVRLTFAVTVSQNITVGEAISNVAQVQELSQPDDGLLFRATNVVATPGLDADKRVAPPGDVFVGNILTYTIVMSNNGTAPAQVSFSDPLPAHTTYVTGSAQIAPATHDAPVYHPVPPTLTWDDEIAPGEQATLTFQARVEPGTLTGTVVGNVAWLQELTEPGPVFSTSVTNTVLAPVFTATKHSTPPGGVRVGETISYSIVLTNAEEGIAQVVVTDSIPAHTTYISASAGTSGGEAPPVYDPVNDWLTWQGDITPRSVVTLTFAVMVDLGTGDGEIIANVAQVQEMSRPDIVSGVSVTNPVIAPDVSILKQVEPSGDVLAGTALSYTVVIINDGGAAAQVTFSDTMPAHTTFVTDSARVLPETHLSPSYADGTLTWQDEIGPGQLAAISFEAQVEPGTPAGVTIYNVAWVQELSNPTSVYSDSATNSVLAPAFAAVKRSTPSGSVHPGDVLDYNIILANAASEGIARAVVTDTIPDHTTYISRSAGIDAGGLPLAAPGYDPVNDRLTWQGDIPSGSTITLTFAVTVSLDITTATVITNTAWVDELSDPAGAVAYSAFNDVVTGYDIYLPVVLRNY